MESARWIRSAVASHVRGRPTRRFRSSHPAASCSLIGRAPIAVGYSLGSAVAAQLRARHPERVAGLVLCAAAGGSAPPLSPSGDISDVPTAVVVTRQDRLIPAWRQLELARSLPGATVHLVDGNHFAFSQFGVFVP